MDIPVFLSQFLILAIFQNALLLSPANKPNLYDMSDYDLNTYGFFEGTDLFFGYDSSLNILNL